MRTGVFGEFDFGKPACASSVNHHGALPQSRRLGLDLDNQVRRDRGNAFLEGAGFDGCRNFFHLLPMLLHVPVRIYGKSSRLAATAAPLEASA